MPVSITQHCPICDCEKVLFDLTNHIKGFGTMIAGAVQRLAPIAVKLKGEMATM
jgi:hypothetical protein